MSGYTVGEITGWLVLTAVLGFALGWLAHGLVARRAEVPEVTPPAPAAPTPDRPVVDEPTFQPPTADAEVVAAAEAPPAGFTPGPVEGSALPLDGGASPGPEWTVKANLKSKVFHDPASPFYLRTTAHVWFRDAEAALAAGFRAPRR